MTIAAAAVALLLAHAAPRPAVALETDQFTVPPKPLADIGPELAAEVLARIDAAAARVNARAAAHGRRAGSARGFWRRHHLRERDRNLGEAALAREVYRELAGGGLPECRIERWVRTHRFGHEPSRFEMTCGGGAYGASPLGRSPFLLSLSPTVNVFGVYCGADKVGHVFQQGYQYYETFLREEARDDGGADEPAALGSAVRRGVGQERGFYGLALVGVYSNADLAANYAGLKLYLNLTRPVHVGRVHRRPLFALRDGAWVRDPDRALVNSPASTAAAAAAEAFLRPFVSNHFNEAMNPSLYTRPTRDTVRTRWHARGRAWATFYGATRAGAARRLTQLATWHGEPYGHSGFDALVTAADTCFDAGPKPHAPVARARPRKAARGRDG